MSSAAAPAAPPNASAAPPVPAEPAPARHGELLAGPHVAAHFHVLPGGVGAGPATPGGPLADGYAVAVCTRHRPDAVVRFVQSLAGQGAAPIQLIIVDASTDARTEHALRALPVLARCAARVDYVRVTAELAGLTRQRNVALRWAAARLVAFFDDDVVLLPGALEEMARVHAALGPAVAGVGVVIENERAAPSALWRLRAALRIVPSLRPGSYAPSGMSVPWSFLHATTAVVDGDWLPGCAAMWRTEVARAVGFDAGFTGYGNGEDLDFSLRARAHGRLVVAGAARVLHLHAEGGRPDPERSAYDGARNLLRIHGTCGPVRRPGALAWFIYAYACDTALRLLTIARPGPLRARWQFVRGRMRFLWELARRGRARVVDW